MQTLEGCVRAPTQHRSLRKDVLDTIDGGAKVALAFRRVTDPARAEKEAAEAKAAAEAEAAAAKKAGSWGGLPKRTPPARHGAPPRWGSTQDPPHFQARGAF